jgi:apolipoprotein N-acyltransferase
VEDLLSCNRQEARGGAKIITWSETGAFILKEDEPDVLEQSRSLAREESVYLQLGLMVIRLTDQFPFGENRAILIDPSGNVVWDYHKAYPVPVGDGREIAPGPAVVPMTQTPYRLLAGVICYDMDYTPYMRHAGLAQVGLVMAPADDWLAIENDHAHISVYRAVETVFRCCAPSKGVSLAVDPLGHELASGEYYTTDRLAIVAAMPVRSLPTLYSRICDLFVYGCILALIALVVLGLARRQTTTAPLPYTV